MSWKELTLHIIFVSAIIFISFLGVIREETNPGARLQITMGVTK